MQPTPNKRQVLRSRGLSVMDTNLEEFRFHHFADPESVHNFLAVFSRFEYALKLSGWAKGDQSRVGADWDGFAASLSPHFQRERTPGLKAAADYLLQHPPAEAGAYRHNRRLGPRTHHQQ